MLLNTVSSYLVINFIKKCHSVGKVLHIYHIHPQTLEKMNKIM